MKRCLSNSEQLFFNKFRNTGKENADHRLENRESRNENEKKTAFRFEKMDMNAILPNIYNSINSN